MAFVCLQRSIKLNRTLILLRRLLSNKEISLEMDTTDVIDTFTSKLVQKKTNKWEAFKIRKLEPFFPLNKPKCLNVQVEQLKPEVLDELFLEAVEGSNEASIKFLITECKCKNITPSISVILTSLDYFARNTDVNAIESIKELVCVTDNTAYITNGKFNHYLAEALWMKGNVITALELLEEVYRRNIYLRRRIRLMLKYLIMDLTSQSEAVLVNIIKFSERIHKDYQDYFPLMCVWQVCILSEWFTDQMLAIDLMDKYEGLCKVITQNLSYVVAMSLLGNQIDVVYRLLEVFLKHDLKLQSSILLIALFNYRFRQGDLKSCSEIIQWSLQYNVTLPSLLQTRFLTLLVKKTDVQLPPKEPIPQYQLKF